jgi:N-acylneuraminate cytidylyltransferase
MSETKTILIIPARGGSKRLANKNTKTLAGVPLLVHSILYAKQNKHLLDAIYVSTDDAAIKTIALQQGVQVIERPKHLSDDTASTVSVLKHVLESVDQVYDAVILLQATNPLRPDSLLRDALRAFEAGGFDSLMTVSRNHQKLGKISDGHFVPYNYTMGQRSQDLEPLYFENGLLYITKVSLILDGRILGDNNLPYIVEHPYAQVDIDTEGDFEYADYLLKKMNME